MRSMAVIVILKIDRLRLQIGRGPEQDVVEILTANRADKSLYEGMRKRHVRTSMIRACQGKTHLLHSLKESPEASPWSRQWRVDLGESIRFGSANAAA